MPNIEIGVDFMVKENFIYVGIDLHKETHTAVMIDCYNQKLGEITFPNRPADFPKLVTKVKKCNTDGKEVVYGLENAYGYGRALAVWLIDKFFCSGARKDRCFPWRISYPANCIFCRNSS